MGGGAEGGKSNYNYHTKKKIRLNGESGRELPLKEDWRSWRSKRVHRHIRDITGFSSFSLLREVICNGVVVLPVPRESMIVSFADDLAVVVVIEEKMLTGTQRRQ